MLGKRDVFVYLDCLRLIKLMKLICYFEFFFFLVLSVIWCWFGFFFIFLLLNFDVNFFYLGGK